MILEQVLGSKGVLTCAKHWEAHGHLMEKIISDELLDYALTQEYTPKEIAAYRSGLAKIAEIYRACSIEIENKTQTGG